MEDSPIADAPKEGLLESVSVPLLLAQAWRDEQSGLLQLANGKSERHLEVRRGSPIAIESSQREATFARFLEDSNLITNADRLAVEKLSTERECPEASAVLALKLLDPKALYQAMRREARSRIAETFEWKVGHYRWTDDLPEESPAAKPHDILSLFQEQLPARWGTDRLFESILAVQHVHGDILPRYRKIAHKLARAGTPAQEVIRKLDGSTPLGRVLGECAGDPLAAATLWTVLYAGVLRMTDGKTRVAHETAALEFDVHVEIETATQTTPTQGASQPSQATQSSSGDPKADALRGEIESLLGQLEELDHYSALGLDEGAGPAQFKKAYFKAAKKYHPDTLARMGLEDLKDAAARVFARIAEAFETLSDPQKKAAYDDGGGMAPEIDTARLAQAETAFRKGEILAKMGNFEGALEYFESAVELWPEEPAYQEGLAWSLFKKPQTDLDRAAHHLEIASSQAPEDARVTLRLGLVARAKGETNRANELTAKARALDPNVHE